LDAANPSPAHIYFRKVNLFGTITRRISYERKENNAACIVSGNVSKVARLINNKIVRVLNELSPKP
jgi:hypothetical protein